MTLPHHACVPVLDRETQVTEWGGLLADRLGRPIVNDIGPEISRAAIDRILDHADSAPEFATLGAAEAWFRAAYTPFGPADDGFGQCVTRTSVCRRADGRFTTHCDPAIAVRFTASAQEPTSWDRYEWIARRRMCCAVRAPTSIRPEPHG